MLFFRCITIPRSRPRPPAPSSAPARTWLPVRDHGSRPNSLPVSASLCARGAVCRIAPLKRGFSLHLPGIPMAPHCQPHLPALTFACWPVSVGGPSLPWQVGIKLISKPKLSSGSLTCWLASGSPALSHGSSNPSTRSHTRHARTCRCSRIGLQGSSFRPDSLLAGTSENMAARSWVSWPTDPPGLAEKKDPPPVPLPTAQSNLTSVLCPRMFKTKQKNPAGPQTT